MAVSKRLRFEILRRDEFKCRYCHKADVELTVDHVVPVALGGTDDPSNLAAACKGCNGGKTSTTPDAPLVEQVRDDAMRWQVAWNAAVAKAEYDGEQRAAAIATVRHNYVAAHTARYGLAPILGDDTDASIGRWIDLGLPISMIDKAISSTIGRSRIRPEGRFAYFAGCCWGLLRDLQERTSQILKQESPSDNDEAAEADETSLLERIEGAYGHGWDYETGAPDPEAWRSLAVYTAMASAAGYDETAIAYAAFRAGGERETNLGLYLKTVKDVIETEAEAGPGSPYGSMSPDNLKLLPSQAERDADIIAEAAVVTWRNTWRDSLGDPPDKQSAQCAEFRAWARDVYLSSGDANEVAQGAEWAGASGSTNLSTAIDEAEAHRATEPAVSAWSSAWYAATGLQPRAELQDAFWKDCYALHAIDTWDHQIIAAAAFAGAHATTRMHFGLDSKATEAIGVAPVSQRVEDLWARTWSIAHHQWPTEGDRVELRSHLSAVRHGAKHFIADVTAAAVVAAVYGSADVTSFLLRSLSALNAAADLPHLGGE